MELVSVIIPCYRQACFIPDAIESVLSQTYPNYEILVVDDRSPDNLEATVARYPTVRYLSMPKRLGTAEARNQGIRASHGSYLVCLDADDRLLPNHLEVSLRAFQLRPDLAMDWGDYRWFGSEDTWHVHDCQPKPDYYGAMLRFGFMGPPATIMVRRQAMLEVGGFRSKPQPCEDLDCWLRLARLFPVQCHHEIVAEYRRHPGQQSRQWDRLLMGGIFVLQDQWQYVRGNAAYKESYRLGLLHHREASGEPLVWETVAAYRAGDWKTVFRYLMVLAKFYPIGLVALLHTKLRKTLRHRTAQHFRDERLGSG